MKQVIALIIEHAQFEKAVAPRITASRLKNALASQFGFLVLVAAEGNQIVGYLSATRDFSTWDGQAFIQMDCLFVSEKNRSEGIGQTLVDSLIDYAKNCQINCIQWQTPAWNRRAVKFYKRLGALESLKRRFVLDIKQRC